MGGTRDGADRAVVLDAVVPEAAGRELLAQDHGESIDNALPHAQNVAYEGWGRS